MSVMSLANSLMLDFRCVIVPRFVYATGSAFQDGAISNGKVGKRIDELATELVRFAKALTNHARSPMPDAESSRENFSS
jgi:hypothetical protein